MSRYLNAPNVISILLLIQHVGLSFGYVACIRNHGAVYCHSRRIVRLMAEPQPQPSSPHHDHDTPITDTKEEVKPTRLSKRKRLKDIARRFRRLPSSLRAFDGTSNHDDETVQIEETNNQIESRKEKEKTKEQPTPKEEMMDASSNEPILVSRQSRAADNVDLSGTWRPIVTSEFKKEYDSYLVNCGQPYMFRKVCVNGIGYQKEIIRQLNDGVDLEITASNPAGDWKRTLVASDESKPFNVTITDPDRDKVQVEAWWEENGTRHKSILREKPVVQGGVFETVRFLESENVLVCESKFHPSPSSVTKFKYGHVCWKFQREHS